MIGKLNSLLKIIQGNGGTVSFTHKYLRVCCGLGTMLVLGDTTLNKIILESAFTKPRVWKK